MSNDSSKAKNNIQLHGHNVFLAGQDPSAEPSLNVLSAKPAWGPLAAILYSLAAFLGSQIVAYFIAMAGARSLGFAASSVTDTIIGQFAFILMAETLSVLAIVLFVRSRHATLSQAGINQPRWVYLGYGLGGFAVYFVTYAIAIAILTQLIPSLNMNQAQDIGFTNPVGSRELLITFFSLAVLPPVAEEVLFRGFMFRGLRNKLPFVWAAIVTSLLFAVGHLEFGNGQPLLWVAAIDTFMLSLVLCYIREKTDSIWAGVVIHALKNTLAFSVLYIFK